MSKKLKLSTPEYLVEFIDQVNDSIRTGEFKLSTKGDKWSLPVSEVRPTVRHMKKVATISLVSILFFILIVPFTLIVIDAPRLMPNFLVTVIALGSAAIGAIICTLTLFYLMRLTLKA